jgi:hypothetical protein
MHHPIVGAPAISPKRSFAPVAHWAGWLMFTRS